MKNKEKKEEENTLLQFYMCHELLYFMYVLYCIVLCKFGETLINYFMLLFYAFMQ